MVEVRKYLLTPTERIPNSPRPLLHYKRVLTKTVEGKDHLDPLEAYEMVTKNGWKVFWFVKYGPTQYSHYHSRAHETMSVLSGTATIRFGVADTSDNLEEYTTGGAWESGGVELQAEPGDVFIIPAGVAHKTYHAVPASTQTLLTPGTGHGIEADDAKKILGEIHVDGFTMMGAYPLGYEWDFVLSGGEYEKCWSVPKPHLDPVFGESAEGLRALWPGSDAPPAEISNVIK